MRNVVNHHTSYNYSKFSGRLLKESVLGVGSVFKWGELVCWRSDLSFLNLRVTFVNSLKALNVCWMCVRNNKRLVFVGEGGKLIMEGCKDGMDWLGYNRDRLPVLGSRVYDRGVRWCRSSSRRKGVMLFSKLIKLTGKKSGTARDRLKSYYEKRELENRLQGEVVKWSCRVCLSVYKEVERGYFSNTEKGLRTRLNNVDVDVGSVVGSRYKINKCVGLSVNIDRDSELVGGGMWCSGGKWLKGVRVSNSVGVVVGSDSYKWLIEENKNKDWGRFGVNWNVKEADCVFFTNGDEMSGLAYEVKKLKIPTIGIMSGLKGKVDRGGVKLMDSVDYVILGNPYDSLFVMMMLRVFMRVLMKGYK